MRALLLHTRNYHIKITGLSTRPASIKPEPLEETEQSCKDCIVILTCFERHDTVDCVGKLAAEVKEMIKDTKDDNVVIVPFAHLSSSIAPSELALKLLDNLTDKLKSYNPVRTHFGSDKELLLDIFGHPGNVRFREF